MKNRRVIWLASHAGSISCTGFGAFYYPGLSYSHAGCIPCTKFEDFITPAGAWNTLLSYNMG
ncbi:MAG: hypothetical protein GY749_10455 [Desulfobacteraceae bacterium]|nr:hypothetical protein [Desulfobacteraceae bacterium]